jgi:hypothetical protein
MGRSSDDATKARLMRIARAEGCRLRRVLAVLALLAPALAEVFFAVPVFLVLAPLLFGALDALDWDCVSGGLEVCAQRVNERRNELNRVANMRCVIGAKWGDKNDFIVSM